MKAEPRRGHVGEIVVLKAHKTNKILPPGYSSDPDAVGLRRADGSVVACYPKWGFQPLLALEEAEIGPRARRVRVVAIMAPRRDGGG